MVKIESGMDKFKTFFFVVFLFGSVSCSHNNTVENYVVLSNMDGLKINLGEGVNKEIADKIYNISVTSYPNVLVYKGILDIRSCSPDERCSYILTYRCEYDCWGNLENRICGIKIVGEGNGMKAVYQGMVGTQIEC